MAPICLVQVVWFPLLQLFNEIQETQGCTPCYVEKLNALQQILLENTDYVSVLCSSNTSRDLMILKNTNKLNLSVYFIPFDAFDWIAEESQKPYIMDHS